MSQLARFLGECRVVARISPAPQAARWLAGAACSLAPILRRRSLGPADDRLGTSFRIRTPSQTLTFSNAGFGIAREIFGHGCYGDIRLSGPSPQVLDLGANAGLFSIHILASNPAARAQLVEIQPDFCDIARANLARNGLAARATVVNAWAGSVDSRWARDFMAHHPQVPAFDIAAYCETVGECDLLKCDIEGAEFALFDPAAQWLRRVKRIAVEYHWDHEAGDRLQAQLESAGFATEKRIAGSLGHLHCVRR